MQSRHQCPVSLRFPSNNYSIYSIKLNLSYTTVKCPTDHKKEKKSNFFSANNLTNLGKKSFLLKIMTQNFSYFNSNRSDQSSTTWGFGMKTDCFTNWYCLCPTRPFRYFRNTLWCSNSLINKYNRNCYRMVGKHHYLIFLDWAEGWNKNQ